MCVLLIIVMPVVFVQGLGVNVIYGLVTLVSLNVFSLLSMPAI